jgi:hypothetical protein
VERTLRKQLHASVDTAKFLRKTADKTQASRALIAEEQHVKQQALLAQSGLAGFAGQKLGKHVVREGEVDVQLGEELSKSLRGLQVCLCTAESVLRRLTMYGSPQATCFVINIWAWSIER